MTIISDEKVVLILDDQINRYIKILYYSIHFSKLREHYMGKWMIQN